MQLFLFLCGIGFAGWLLFQRTVHTQLRDRVQDKISSELAGTGLAAQLGQARFHEGEGIQLNNLNIRLDEKILNAGRAQSDSNAADHSRIEIYEAFIHAPVSLTELASTELKIQAVRLRRVKLTLVRTVDGEWDFQHVLSSLDALRPDGDSPIPVKLSDCEVRIFDHSSTRTAPITLSNLNINVLPRDHEGRTVLQITGGFQSPAISQIEFTTFLDQQTNSWQTEIGATDAMLSGDLIAVLPPVVQSELKDLQTVSGKINFVANATGKMSLDDIPTFKLNGNVVGLTIDDARLPLPIRNVAAKFSANNSGFAIDEATGKLGLADFGGNYWQRGYLERQQWHCDGHVYQFNFDHSPRLSRWLPDYCKKFCDEYSPSGKSDIEFDLTHDGTRLHRKITGQLTGMSFSYIRLPYKIENCVGDVNWRGDVCTFNVRSLTGKQEIEFNGSAKGFGKNPTYQINVSVPGALPIDQKMLNAIEAQPKLANVIRAFSPTGRVAGIGTIEKRSPTGGISKTFDVRLKHCSIQHNDFHYPIHNIVGLIKVENDNYTFKELSGNNSSGKVTCNGTWDPIGGLNTRFLCRSIPLNDQLRFALKQDLQEIWNGFRPRGTLDFMRIDMQLPIGKSEVELIVEARMEKPNDETEANHISIYPIWFPYDINHVTGVVNIGAGQIKLTDVKGKHQRTWMVCQGDGRYTDDSWSVRLVNLLVGSLKVDEDFLDAIPDSLAPPIRQLKYQGLLNVSGEITIAGTSAANTVQVAAFKTNQRNGDFQSGISNALTIPQPTSSMAWDLRLDMNQAKMNIGLPAENVFGNIKLLGVYDGQMAECRGDLDIDSMTIYDAQITKIQGPIWLDNARVAAGQFAGSHIANSSINVSPIGRSNSVNESVTGQMHDGFVKFDAQLSSGSNNEYYVQASLNDGCLATACREFGADLENIEGHSFAVVRLAGDYSGIHSQRGDGTIQLRDAKIYELPVFLSLLKVLNVRQVSRTAFDSSNIDFTIEGENINFERMEFLGDAISLIGNGKMNLDREIDLNFYSVMGRNRINIPLISDLYRASSQKILWINVDGTLDNPQHHRNVLPQLNDSLKQLFQPRERSSIAGAAISNAIAPSNQFAPTRRSATAGERTANRFDEPQTPSSRFTNPTRR